MFKSICLVYTVTSTTSIKSYLILKNYDFSRKERESQKKVRVKVLLNLQYSRFRSRYVFVKKNLFFLILK